MVCRVRRLKVIEKKNFKCSETSENCTTTKLVRRRRFRSNVELKTTTSLRAIFRTICFPSAHKIYSSAMKDKNYWYFVNKRFTKSNFWQLLSFRRHLGTSRYIFLPYFLNFFICYWKNSFSTLLNRYRIWTLYRFDPWCNSDIWCIVLDNNIANEK